MGVPEFVIVIVIVIVTGVVAAVCVWYGRRLAQSAAAHGEQRRKDARTIEVLERRARDAQEREAKAVGRIDELEAEVARLRTLSPPPPIAATRAQSPDETLPPAPADDPGETRGATEGWQTLGYSPQTRRMLSREPDVSVVQVDVSVHDAPTGRNVVVTRTTGKPPHGMLDSLDGMLRSFEAGEIVKAGWQPATESWTIQDPLGADHAATALEKGKLSVHDLVVGRPAERLGDQFGLDPGLADSLAYAAARTVPLPGDPQVKSVVKVIRVVGVVVGLATGQPALAISCVKSLVRTELTARLTRELKGLTKGPAAGTRPPRPKRRTDRVPGPDRDQSAPARPNAAVKRNMRRPSSPSHALPEDQRLEAGPHPTTPTRPLDREEPDPFSHVGSRNSPSGGEPNVLPVPSRSGPPSQHPAAEETEEPRTARHEQTVLRACPTAEGRTVSTPPEF